MKKITAVGVLLIVISTIVCAGPFGFDKGTSSAELGKKIKLKQEGAFSYSSPLAPKPHSDFDDYRLLITPIHGLCKVTAWTPQINVSVYGTELLGKFDSIDQAISAKYGNGKRYDFLKAGSIWREDNEWMTSLEKKERVLMKHWNDKQSPMPDNIIGITLEAVASSRTSSMIRLTYAFSNEGECIDWVQSQKNSSL